mmetsp:Transcript_6365/g.16277  ORF Transcript_6365/g.16277 Transcript_6365/m.16277 type:complete len:126 (-) Transcript_6365:418-795(-)
MRRSARTCTVAVVVLARPMALAQLNDNQQGCSPLGECEPCEPEHQDELLCAATGFAQQLTCAGPSGAANTTKLVSCVRLSGDAGAFMRFELAMLIVFLASLVCANRRKSRLIAQQHQRISQYLHT